MIRACSSGCGRDTLGSAIDLSVAALRALGFGPHRAARAGRLFKKHDEPALRDIMQYIGDDEAYKSAARKHIANLEAVLRGDRENLPTAKDAG